MGSWSLVRFKALLWFQCQNCRESTITKGRFCVTASLALNALVGILKVGGFLGCIVQHTSASLTINENYDSDVLEDVETWLNGVVPEVRKISTYI